MKQMKKWISLLLALVVCLSLSVSALAEGEGVTGDQSGKQASAIGIYTAQTGGVNLTGKSREYAEFAGKPLWLLKADGFTEEEKLSVEIYLGDTKLTDGLMWQTCSTNAQNFDLQFIVPKQADARYILTAKFSGTKVDMELRPTGQGGGDPDGQLPSDQGSTATVGEYTVGFGNETTGFWTRGGWQHEYRVTSGYQKCDALLPIRAGKLVTGQGEDHYEMADGSEVALAIQKITLTPVNSADDTFFSLSGDGFLGTLSGEDLGSGVQLYFKNDSDWNWFNVTATVKVQILKTKQEQTVTVSLVTARYLGDHFAVDLSAATDVDKLNQMLQEAVKKVEPPTGMTELWVDAKLPANVTYTGEIKIPELPSRVGIRLIGAEDGTTVVKGRLNLNGELGIAPRNLHFVAPTKGEGIAIFNGHSWVEDCTFQNYGTAWNATVGYIFGQNNVFVDNYVAIRIDTADAKYPMRESWDQNTFIGNTTAVKIVSLKNCAPYHFRISYSNFINNGTDFDISGMDGRGTFYMYNNYYGKTKNNVDWTYADLAQATDADLVKGLLIRQPASHNKARTQCDVEAKLRLAYPVRQGATGESLSWPDVIRRFDGVESAALLALTADAPYVNYLTADWETDESQTPTAAKIINDMANRLTVDASAFAEATRNDKVITVVGGEVGEITLGTWNFGKQGGT